ncbi:P-loop NTPase fold protein [Gluconacetobacter entanii]|nr:P-loop NTPase fold protein [Gluconacetobacter entanii]
MTTDPAARAYLDYYLDRPGNPDFAVMLEGPWGSGKSFFIEQYF